jgi:hypothetical protein
MDRGATAGNEVSQRLSSAGFATERNSDGVLAKKR